MTGGQAGPHRDTEERLQQGADSCMREAGDEFAAVVILFQTNNFKSTSSG